MDEVNDMNKRDFKNFITKRSSIWTLSLCITGILVLGGIAALNGARRTKDGGTQMETEPGQTAYLDGDAAGGVNDDELFPTLNKDDEEDMAQASGNTVDEDVPGVNADADTASDNTAGEADAGNVNDDAAAGTDDPAGTEAAAAQGNTTDAAEAASGGVISEQALLDAGVNFTEQESLLWPAAGTILIDYSMDGSVYFPTLDQYKYNPALIIGSEVGNQVLAAAKGIVEMIRVEDETGITLVLNIGNGYKLTYGQLKELAVAEGDVVDAGAVLGYVSEPTKYYTVEGSNLYFGMTKDDAAVDPVLYLE